MRPLTAMDNQKRHVRILSCEEINEAIENHISERIENPELALEEEIARLEQTIKRMKGE